MHKLLTTKVHKSQQSALNVSMILENNRNFIVRVPYVYVIPEGIILNYIILSHLDCRI